MRLIKIIFIKSRIVVKKFIESLLLFMLTFFGRYKTITIKEKIEKIIIPLISGIGDAVIFTCCLQQINKLFPNAEILIITTNRTQDVLDDTYPNTEFLKLNSYQDLFKLRHKYDLMISPCRNIKHYLIALITHPTSLLGYNYTLFINKRESHIVRANRILHQLGYNGFNDPLIKVSKTTIDNSKNLIRTVVGNLSKSFICLIVGGRWKSKIYSPSKYRLLIDKLVEKYNVEILLVGNDREIGNYIAEGKKKVHNFAGKTSIKEAMGLIYHSDLIIGPDGGLLNIAVALNKPIIGLFGSVDPTTIIPKKYLNHVLFVRKCEYQPCYSEEHEPLCPYTEAICMDIEIDDVLNKIDKIFLNKKF